MHFLVEVNPPLCRLLDLKSRNKTYVNGQVAETAELADGDEIRAGRTVLRVTIERPAPRADAPQPAAGLAETRSLPANTGELLHALDRAVGHLLDVPSKATEEPLTPERLPGTVVQPPEQVAAAARASLASPQPPSIPGDGGRVAVKTTSLERAELKRDQIHAFGPDRDIPRCAGSMSAVIEPAPG